MIEEEQLRDLLDSAADSYPVPPDGIERILAATRADEAAGDRGAAHAVAGDLAERRRRRSRWRVVAASSGAVACVVALVLAAVLVGHGPGRNTSAASSSGVSRDAKAAAGAQTQPAAPAPVPQSASSSASSDGLFNSNCANCHQAAGQGGALSTRESAATSGGASPRIVETGTASLQVRQGQVPAALEQLRSTATQLGGLVAASSSESGSSPTGSVKLRVPVARFADLMARLPRIGTVVSSDSSSKDVTGQYVDLQARLTALTATRNTYLTMLGKATTIGDTLAVQQRLDDIQQQIEQIQGQQKVLADESSLATLDVNVSEKGAPVTVPPSHDSGFTGAVHRAWDRFTGGLEAVVAASGTFALVLIALAIAGVAGRILYRSVRRRLV